MRPEAAEVTPEVPARAQRLSRRPPRAQTRLVDALRLSFTVVIGRLSTSGPPIQLAGLRSQEPRWWRLDIPTITQDSLSGHQKRKEKRNGATPITARRVSENRRHVFPVRVGKVVTKGDKTGGIDPDRNQICLVKHQKCRMGAYTTLV